MTWLAKLFGVQMLTIECGTCHERRDPTPGERQQLFLELWDSEGRMYEKWPVGDGELLARRTVDFSILREIRQRVQAINAARRNAG